MKILYYAPFDESFMSQWQRVQIFDELSHYNVSIEVINPLNYHSFHEANDCLLKRLRSGKDIDLFMNCASSEMLFEETMSVVSALTIPKLLICFDNLHAPFMHTKIARYFDLIWLTSWETEYIFKKLGCNTVFLPYASNPYLFKDMYTEQVNKICFVGSPYGTRSLYFSRLNQNHISMDIFCKSNENDISSIHGVKKSGLCLTSLSVFFDLMSFPIGRRLILGKIKSMYVKKPLIEESEQLRLLNKLSFEDMNRAYSNYALSLNIIDLRNTGVLKQPVHKLHLRTFEIPMSYGLEFSSYNNELARYFSEDEVVFFDSSEEMLDKAQYYTNPKNERIVRSMKLNARQRALNEHTWAKRFSVVFDTMGLRNPISQIKV